MPKNGSATMYTSGWPKNQNRCCHRMTPPLAGSNTCAPRWRSISSPNSAAVSTGNAIRIRIAVKKMFQVKIGIRNIVMPGARRHTMVVMKLTPPRMVPRPATMSPVIQRSPPVPGECVALDSGV